ncbi:unnamed protein product, partial [Effrenium voratum]
MCSRDTSWNLQGITWIGTESALRLAPVWTLHLLATEFPEQRMTFSSFRCKVGSRLVPGEVSTSRVASCQLSVADVEAIGPGRHFVEVLPDGIHETRSEPQVLLEVYPEKAQIESLPAPKPGGERGIIVRGTADLVSPQLGRVSTGAILKEVELCEGRMSYELVSGTGPAKGWVTMNLKGKDLLLKLEKEEVTEVSTSEGESSEPKEELPEEEAEAFQQYLEKFGENRCGGPGYNRKAFPWATGTAPPKRSQNQEELEAALSAPKPKVEKKARRGATATDSDGEEVPLCCRCHMPVGEFAYEGREGRGSCVHAECMAQILVEDAQRQEDRRAGWENEKKLRSRKEYDIGWRMESVPKNGPWAQRFGLEVSERGLVALVLDEASKTVKAAPTLEPAAGVNLEYLLLALKVRKTASREPLFSLDPVDPQNLEKTPQKKMYEPSWLAGTSVGDVMFQADYFLKELALGEYEMPVAGMLSVFDWSELSDKDKAWAGREWFVVRKAEVRLAEDKTLVPFVKMGVEAREQVVTKKGLEDAPVTTSNHPLKKFADAFSRHFDLIAERKSVVFHLRELAKASVMAKYLVDSKIRLDPQWYKMADEIVKSTKKEAHPEIPQLWNMRGNSRIQLKNGRLIDMFTGGQKNLQAIYGGVEFGLDRFELAQRHALQGQTGMQLGQSGRPMFMPQRFQLGQRAEMPQGVDLNLDKFDLSRVDRFTNLAPHSAAPDSAAARVTLGRAFLRSLQQGLDLKPEHREILVKVFQSPQCDRTEEGNSFIPPDPNMEYTSRLRSMVHEEKSLLERRKLRFCDKGFIVGNAGQDFPRSWTSRFQIEKDGHAAKPGVSPTGLNKVEVDSTFAAKLVNEVLPAAAPEFQKSTEDGTIFRIYHIGSLEIRTTQEKDKEEKVGVVYSGKAAGTSLVMSSSADLPEHERLEEIKVFLEPAEASGSQPHFYVVCLTVKKNIIVSEMLANGTTTFVVNPKNLEDRNSLAKHMFRADCLNLTLKDLKDLKKAQCAGGAVSISARKQYVKSVFSKLTGKSFKGKWGGFIRRYAGPAVFLGGPPMAMPRTGGLGNGTWSSDLMSLRSRGGLLYVKGQRLPKDADCIFGEDKPLEGLYAVYAAAVYYNETTISCIIPQEAPAGGSVLFRLAAAGQIVDVDHPTSNMRLAIGEQLQNVDPHAGTVFLRERSEILIGGMPAGFGRLSPYDGGGSCALGPPDEHFNHTKEEQSFGPHCAGCGAVCRATPKHLPEVELRMRMSGTAGWPGGAMQLLPSLPALGDLRMTPREAFAEDVQLRFRGEGLQDYVQMFPHRFSCHIGPDLAAPASLVRGDWPLSCHFPDLGAVKGLEVRVQLVFSHAGIQKNLGPAFPLTLRLRPVVSAVSPPLALAQLATPLALQVARLPASAQLRCDFGRFGTSLAIATGSSVHCRAPAISSKTAAGSLQLRVAIEENFRQQIVVMAVEDFRWIAAPADPVVEALPPYTAPLGAAVFL